MLVKLIPSLYDECQQRFEGPSISLSLPLLFITLSLSLSPPYLHLFLFYSFSLLSFSHSSFLVLSHSSPSQFHSLSYSLSLIYLLSHLVILSPQVVLLCLMIIIEVVVWYIVGTQLADGKKSFVWMRLDSESFSSIRRRIKITFQNIVVDEWCNLKDTDATTHWVHL